MEIAYSFFAEAIQLTSDNRVNILGADLHTIPVQGPPPWTVQSLSLLANIMLDKEEFGHLCQVSADLISPDGRPMDPHMEHAFIAPVPDGPDRRPGINVVLKMNGMALPAAGTYTMRVRAADQGRNFSVEKLIRLRVLDVGPQQIPT